MARLGLLTKEMSVDLFIRPDGKAMLFWMSSSSPIETHIKTLVEARGGVLLVDDVSSDNSENVIRLVEEDEEGKPLLSQFLGVFKCDFSHDRGTVLLCPAVELVVVR